MTPYYLDPELSVALADNCLIISGDLSAANGPLLLQWLESLPVVSRLDLAELDINDGVAATYAVNAVRLLLSRDTPLVIDSAPQVLAHNLYRTGMLEGDSVRLVDMREDEAYS